MAEETRLQRLQTRLAEYQTAEDKILSGAQEYSTGTLRLRRADLPKVAEMIGYLEKEIAAEEAKASGRARNCVKRVVPLDY